MKRMGRYLYGLVRSTASFEHASMGIALAGKQGRVFTICVDDLGAVVSEYPATERILPLRRYLEPHHRVIRDVMSTRTIVPMAFGQVARNEREITRMLRQHHDAILSQLERLDGKVEVSVKLRWDVDNIFEYFVSADPVLASYRDELFGKSHAPSQAEKVELGRMFESRREDERRLRTDRLLEALRERSVDIKVNPPKGETSVADVAFLVGRDTLPSFEQGLYQVAGSYPAEFSFDLGGPFAPFNFVDLDLGLDAEWV